MAAACLGVSSGFAFAMIGATLTTRLAQQGIRKSAVTAFALVFLAYNLKALWAPLVDMVRLPGLARYGQRRSWIWLTGVVVMAAVVNLGRIDPSTSLSGVATAALFVGFAGATFDIVIDAYRIELLQPHQLGVGAGMSQYGWRVGAAWAGAMALVVSARYGWAAAYGVCSLLALPAMVVAAVMGEPVRRPMPPQATAAEGFATSYFRPLAEFVRRPGALIVLAFVLVHKIGDTLTTLTLRLLFEDLRYSNDEIAVYDVGVGVAALLFGVFVGGWMYALVGMRRAVLVSLVLMAASNVSFAVLAAYGHSNLGMAAATGFEHFTSGIGGVAVVAYLSALCDVRFTATQYALLSALASIVGRLLTGATAGELIEVMGFVRFYLLTTAIALPGVLLFSYMLREGPMDPPVGSQTNTGSSSTNFRARRP